jgi:hypothetical protein
MADDPRVAEAKERLRGLVGPAVEQLAGLLESEHDGIRLGAAKEVLDRGGVPTRQEHNVSIEIGIDEEIEELIRGVRRQITTPKGDGAVDNIEDAVVIEDEVPPEIGEQAAKFIGVPIDDRDPEPEEVELVEAWWQAAPAVGETESA